MSNKSDSEVPLKDPTSQLTEPRSFSTGHIKSTPFVEFIVNRLPSKYRWVDLERIYQKYLSKRHGNLASSRSILCYIPIEELLADCFGEYPFHVELAPESIFSKKIHYMAYSLLNTRIDLTSHYKPLRKFRNSRYRKKIERTVVSNEFKNMRLIVKGYLWVCIFYVALGVFMAQLFPGGSVEEDEFSNPIFLTISSVFFTVSIWYLGRTAFGLKRLFKDRFGFQKRLFKAVSAKMTLWRRLILFKLLILYIITTFGAYTICYFCFSAICMTLFFLLLLIF
jgi:hypothetical protein